jgi:hypothetical protein
MESSRESDNRPTSESAVLSEIAGPPASKSGLGKGQLATLLRSAPFLYTGFRKPDAQQAVELASHEVRDKLAGAWYPYAERYFALTRQAPRRVKPALRLRSVTAVAMYTLKFQPEKAAEFWQGLAMDDGLRRNDPRLSLLYRLSSGYGTRPVAFQLHAVAAAWNAFYEGRNLTEIRVDPGKPFRLAGTPVLVEHLDGELDNVA